MSITSTNAVLRDAYWTGDGSATFTVSATNTTTVAENVQLSYAAPSGVTVQGCACALQLNPGQIASVQIAVLVAPDAWHAAPLAGTVTATATTGGAPATTSTIWGIVFPPGPPVPGIRLTVASISLSGPLDLVIRLSNNGAPPATGQLIIALPVGVFAPTASGCAPGQFTSGGFPACGLGTIAPHATHTVTFALNITSDARARAPLTGVVKAVLRPSGAGSIAIQASFQLLRGTGGSTVPVSSPTPGKGASVTGPSGAPGGAAADLPLPRLSGEQLAGRRLASGAIVLLGAVFLGLVVALRQRRQS